MRETGSALFFGGVMAEFGTPSTHCHCASYRVCLRSGLLSARARVVCLGDAPGCLVFESQHLPLPQPSFGELLK